MARYIASSQIDRKENPVESIVDTMRQIGENAVRGAAELRSTPIETRRKALTCTAVKISRAHARILKANATDVNRARENGLSAAKLDRLHLTSERITAIEDTLYSVASRQDPIGEVVEEWKRPSGLRIKKVRTPLGVIGVIFESRPNVFVDAAALCLISGNAVILRGGSDSFCSTEELNACIASGLRSAGLPASCVQKVPSNERAAVGEMLRMTDCIDVIVPRGGKSLVQRVQSDARVPVFAHLEGICHVYVDRDADIDKARRVVLNSKTRRPGICGAVECILVDSAFWKSDGAPFLDDLLKAGVEVRVSSDLSSVVGTVPASSEDFGKEFLDMVVAAKTVNGVDSAVEHIRRFGSGHTDAIITENNDTADRFYAGLDSAILMRNASTQFADGGEFGFGAEIGIATGKVHARGPIGAEHLTSFRYIVEGEGTVRS